MADKRSMALILDDEPECLQYVHDFLESEGLQVEFARTLPEALAAIARQKYQILLVDMNVPDGGAIEPALAERVPIVRKYPGIAFAIASRLAGYGARSIIAYTVHDDEAADHELRKLGCRYVLKGVPELLKVVVRKSLNPGK